MAIIGNIRTKISNTFVAIAICCLVAILLSSDLGQVIAYFFNANHGLSTGTVGGKSISYVDYQELCDIHFARNFKSQGKQPTEAEIIRFKDHIWRQLIEDIIYKKELKKIGMAVGTDELVDLVQGEHIDASISASPIFQNPATGSFDRQKLLDYLSRLSENGQVEWCQHEKDFVAKRVKDKLIKLMQKSCFTTTLEKEKIAQRDNMFCNVDYLYIPFNSISSELVAPTKQQLQEYMNAHRNHYKATESKTIKYITFPVHPDEKDHATFQKELNAILAQFSTTSDPFVFAKEKTDGKLQDTYLTCATDELPDALAKIKHTLQKGMVVGPIRDEGLFIFYKINEIKRIEDTCNYDIAVIQKKSTISDATRNKLFRKVNHFVSQIKKVSDFDELAKKEHIRIQKETISPSDSSIGIFPAREVVCWLYTAASIGKISPVFDLGDAYMLAMMVNQTKEGELLPLDVVYSEVYYKVVNQAKAEIIIDKIKQINATTLQDIAESYGENLTIHSIDALHFSKKNDINVQNAKAFIGKCFGLKPGSISDPIVDNEGVFIACVKDIQLVEQEKASEDPFDSITKGQIDQIMQNYYIGKAMEELTKVTDERYKHG